MKKNSLTLIFFLVLFCLISFNFALAQVDPGNPDTCIIQRIEKVRA